MLVCAAVAALGATAHAAGPTSVNVSEDAAAYTVEVRGPDVDATSVRWTGGRLEIRREGGTRASQQIEMPEAGPGAALTLRRAGDALVVRVEKGGDPGAAATTATRQPGDVLRDQMLSQFATMGQHVAKMMDEAMAEQGLAGFFEESGLLPKGQPATRFELKDAGRTFVLTAAMTEEEAKSVKIAVENDRLLKITSESRTASPGSASSSSATQAVTLPQPVKADEVSMNYKDGQLEIVLPKG